MPELNFVAAWKEMAVATQFRLDWWKQSIEWVFSSNGSPNTLAFSTVLVFNFYFRQWLPSKTKWEVGTPLSDTPSPSCACALDLKGQVCGCQAISTKVGSNALSRGMKWCPLILRIDIILRVHLSIEHLRLTESGPSLAPPPKIDKASH